MSNRLTGFMVFWFDETANSKHFQMNEMAEALSFMEDLRRKNYQFVSMSSQNPDHTGKDGASTITPKDYHWSKEYRGTQSRDDFRSLIAPKAMRHDEY